MRRVRRGGLIGCGGSDVALYRRGAHFVDRILKGAKPGDLPIEQASVFDLAINTRTAKALGVAIPETILIRADKRIESRRPATGRDCARRGPVARGGPPGLAYGLRGCAPTNWLSTSGGASNCGTWQSWQACRRLSVSASFWPVALTK